MTSVQQDRWQDLFTRTDKRESGYVPAYERIAAALGPYAAVCEIGVQRGGSLELWQALFPGSATIVGVDIDPTAVWPTGTLRVVAAQQDPGLATQLNMLQPNGYDLIVDDASHDGQLTWQAFRHLWPLVRPGGYYVIEDWCVGFDTYPQFDDSMLAMAMTLINSFSSPDTDVDTLGYAYGMIVVRKKPSTQPTIEIVTGGNVL